MGVYNPHLPQILGQEFAPIREENITFSPSVNVVELGTRFSLPTSRSMSEGRFYINEYAPGAVGGQVYMVTVYPAGKEDKTGPVRTVTIPCNFAAITGTGISSSGLTVSQSLQSPSDSYAVTATPSQSTGSKCVDMFFNTSAYAQLLTGKRILGVNFLYQLAWDPTNATNPPATAQVPFTFDQILALETGTNPTNVISIPFCSREATYGAALLTMNPPQGRLAAVTEIAQRKLGEMNFIWPSPSITQSENPQPWRYAELARFEASSGADRQRIHIEFGGTSGTDNWAGIYYLGYAALEVVFCEEQRLIASGMTYGPVGNLSLGVQPNTYQLGMNSVLLRDLATFNTNPTIPAGEWTLCLESPDIGDLDGPFVINDISRPAASNTYPSINALRELYPLISHTGVQVNVTQTPGETFTMQDTLVVPQVTLIRNGGSGSATEVQVYGRQAVGQVYGSIVVTQDIYDAGLTSASYPQVKFYARRFGETTVPLTIFSGASSAAITPAEFDALDPIIDGWKEVVLRFGSAPTMGTGTNPQWTWTAPTEVVGNRWEVLGAEAPAVSGVSGSYVTQVPPPNDLSIATYGQPVSGAGINMAWISQYAPPVSAVSDDPSSDMIVLFSQDPPAISGFAISQQNLALSGIGLNCGIAPGFIPTALQYNRLTWGYDPGTQFYDNFERTVVNGWGTATSTQTWSVAGTASDYQVANGVGTVALTSTGSYRITRESSTRFQNVNAYMEISSNTSASGSDHWGSLILRDDGANNHLYAEINFPTDGTTKLILSSVVSAVHTVLGTVSFGYYNPGMKVKVRVQLFGVSFKAKAWFDGKPEPDDWMLQVSTSANPQAGQIGTRSISGGGSPTSIVLSYDNFLVSDISNAYTELQRMDSLTDWQTIMKATNQSLALFNDYEARVDLASSYRIRHVNVYGFAGAWSSTVSNTIPAPGVTCTGMASTDHVMIFSTNSVQSGASNLAYSPGWEGEVNEDFAFPEAAGQVFQTMYNRDYVTVFRPTERGGTNFSRNLLVQAAAITPETLEDFTSLRDMAWADVPYICLRDEDGNRWFTNVSVPSGNVQRSRRLYMAPVSIVEVTNTPEPVDP